MPTNRYLPWWTWLAPFPLALAAGLTSGAFDATRDMACFLLTPFAGVLILWWGPRTLPATFAAGIACALASGWHPLAALVHALPEVVAVAMVWLVFCRVMGGNAQLASQGDAWRYLIGAAFVPAVTILLGRHVGAQALAALGLPVLPIPEGPVLATTMVGTFVVAVPALVNLSPFLSRRGWCLGGPFRAREPIFPDQRRSQVDQAAAALVPLLIVAVSLLFEADFWPFANGLIVIGVALYFGFPGGILATSWMLLTGLVTSSLPDADFAPPWSADRESLEFWANSLLIAGAAFFAGRNLSDARNEIDKRTRLEWELGRAQATLLAAIEQSQAGIIIADAPDGRIRLANAAAVGMRGAVAQPLIDIPISQHADSWQFYHPSGTPWVPDDLPLTRAIREGRSATGIDLIIRNARGEDRWIIASASPIRGLEGGIAGAIAVFTDVTERRKAEEELRHSERRYRTLVNSSSQGFWLLDSEGLTVDVNDALCRMLRITREELIGRGPADFVDASSREVIREQSELRRFIDNRDFELTLVATDGGHIDVRVNATTLRGPGRRFEGSFGFYTDITEQKKAERALRETEARFRAFMDNSPAAMYVTDRNGRFVYANERFKDWYGWDSRFETGVVIALPLSTGGLKHVGDRVPEVVREGRTISREIAVPRRDGSQRDVSVFEFPVIDADGEVFAIGGINLDVTDIRKTAEALHFRVAFEGLIARVSARFINAAPEQVRSELEKALAEVGELTHSDSAQLFAFEDAGPPGTAVAHWSATGNPAAAADTVAADQLPWLEALRRGEVCQLPANGQGLGECASGAGIRALIDVPILRAGVFSGFLRLASRRDNPKWSEIDVSLFKLLAEILGNTLERQSVEEALRRAQKMEAVGQIAGGIAHDFNNLLGAIMGFSSFIVEDLDPKSSGFAFAQRIQKACERAKYMIQRLLTFSRRSGSERQPVRMADILEETAALLAGTIPTTIRLETRIDVPDSRVFADPVQLTQVFMNLCVNARDAIEDEPGAIRIHVHELAAPRSSRSAAWREKGLEAWKGGGRASVGELPESRTYVVVDVSDTGRGMTQDILDQVFEPFFTTKAAHRGTGLGLSVVQGIVIGHSGAVVVRSLPGRGTCFRVLLPTTDLLPPAPDVAVAEVAVARTGRVLVIDDDVDFADVVSITLERSGMEVGVATEPAMALEVFQEDPQAWDVVMTDYAMPVMTGLELIRRIKTLRPAIPCILCTAHAGSRFTPETADEFGITILLEKPVEPSGIVDAVRRCLVSSEETAPVGGGCED